MLRSVDLRSQLHLHPARLAAVELLVRLDGVPDRLVLREEFRRIDRSGPHQLDEEREIAAVGAVSPAGGGGLFYCGAGGGRLLLGGGEARDRERSPLGGRGPPPRE